MSIFYFHRSNAIGQKLSEAYGSHGFVYHNRYEMELKLQKIISECGYDLWPTFHTVIGSLAGSIDIHIPLNPDNELDRDALKLCKNQTPWCFVRVANGPKMSCVVGYCSSGANNPFAMSTTEMSQKGIIKTSVVPRASA